jgi:hypothetical protein
MPIALARQDETKTICPRDRFLRLKEVSKPHRIFQSHNLQKMFPEIIPGSFLTLWPWRHWWRGGLEGIRSRCVD